MIQKWVRLGILFLKLVGEKSTSIDPSNLLVDLFTISFLSLLWYALYLETAYNFGILKFYTVHKLH